MEAVTRQILMVEIDGPDVETAATRIEAALADARVWGEVDGVDAALLVWNAKLAPASA
jgi:hypothetical protein